MTDDMKIRSLASLKVSFVIKKTEDDSERTMKFFRIQD